MFKSKSNVIYVRLPEPEYEFVFREVNKRKMTVKGWMEEQIRKLRLNEERDPEVKV